jgi:diaminopimelate decarboxylase
MMEWAKQIELASGRQVTCIDVGGGWFPDDWDRILLPTLKRLLSLARESLHSLEEVILEPGKGLVQPCGALVVRVIEVRVSIGGYRDVIVDGAISELPEAWSYPHRVILRLPSGEWTMLGRGGDRLLGRLCMEADILRSNISLPDQLFEGQLLALCDSGAYDRSMSYSFGQGYVR